MYFWMATEDAPSTAFVRASAVCSRWEDTMRTVVLNTSFRSTSAKRPAAVRSNYEKFVCDWHYFLLDVQSVLYESEDSELIRNLNMYVVNQFYRKPYDEKRDFYEQFYERLAAGKELLSLGV